MFHEVGLFSEDMERVICMGGTGGFFCVVKPDLNADVVSPSTGSEWKSFRWADEFGNSIAPFFTTAGAGQRFLQQLRDWQLKRYPATFVVAVILEDIKKDTSFYTIDPHSTFEFKALSPLQFLTELIFRKLSIPVETQQLAREHQDIVPVEAFFSEDGDCQSAAEYRRLLEVADLIFAVDVTSGEQSVIFGRVPLENLARTGRSDILGVINVGLDQESTDIEKLATLVKDIKGHHEYFVVKPSVA